MEINPWKGRRVLITGHTGFKGTYLACWLVKKGADVAGFSLSKYHNDILFRKTGIAEKIRDYRGDVRDFKKISSVFEEFRPEVVFHLAAQPLVRQSYKSPKETFDTNVAGTVNVLELIRAHPVDAAVIITSDKVYQNREEEYPYKESDPLKGRDPYSASKSCQDIVTESYRESFFRQMKKHVATARAGNVIGGGDYAEDRLIPEIILSVAAGKEVRIRSPDAVRPWQHVLEPLSGYILLAERLMEGKPVDDSWNFGPEKDACLPVRTIADKMIKALGKGSWVDASDSGNPHEAKLLYLDISKAKKALGWKPKLSIDEAISLTAKAYASRDPMKTISEEIAYYEKR